MNDLRKAAQDVINAFDSDTENDTSNDMFNAVNALHAALAEAPEAMPRTCNPHPDAPHGFNRNASHSEDRYVCDCEGWEPSSETPEPVAYRHWCESDIDEAVAKEREACAQVCDSMTLGMGDECAGEIRARGGA